MGAGDHHCPSGPKRPPPSVLEEGRPTQQQFLEAAERMASCAYSWAGTVWDWEGGGGAGSGGGDEVSHPLCDGSAVLYVTKPPPGFEAPPGLCRDGSRQAQGSVLLALPEQWSRQAKKAFGGLEGGLEMFLARVIPNASIHARGRRRTSWNKGVRVEAGDGEALEKLLQTGGGEVLQTGSATSLLEHLSYRALVDSCVGDGDTRDLKDCLGLEMPPSSVRGKPSLDSVRRTVAAGWLGSLVGGGAGNKEDLRKLLRRAIAAFGVRSLHGGPGSGGSRYRGKMEDSARSSGRTAGKKVGEAVINRLSLLHLMEALIVIFLGQGSDWEFVVWGGEEEGLASGIEFQRRDEF